MEDLENKIKSLTRALVYFDQPGAFDIGEIDKKITSNEGALAVISSIKNTLGAIDVSQYTSDSLPSLVIKANTEMLSDSRLLLRETESQLSQLLGEFDRIGKLVAEIKALGKEYALQNKEARECPLCHTEYDTGILIERINIISPINQGAGGKVESLSNEKVRLNKQIDKLILDNANIHFICSALPQANNSSDKPLKKIIADINEMLAKENDFLQLRLELNSYKERMSTFGINKAEFIVLNEKIKELFGPNLLFSQGQKPSFEKAYFEFVKEVDDLKPIISKLEETKIQKMASIIAALSPVTGNAYVLQDVLQWLEENEKDISRCEEYFARIRQIIDLDDLSNIEEVQLKLSILIKNIQTLKMTIQNQVELQNAEKDLKSGQEYIDKNEEHFKRITKGYNLLKTLSENKGISQLGTFFDQNMREINDIFQTIHSPKEFASFEIKDSKLSLTKVNGEKRKISEISTGQRAALALSIFMSMNRKPANGPKLIILDDPISHTDDLNSLSFLDFLRFFVLKEGKQIFLATANTRLANLMERKFGFLDKDFKKFEFSR